MDMDMVKVLVRASERVHYNQVIEMARHDFERLQEATKAGEEEEIEWLVDKYLDREQISMVAEFQVDETAPCTKNGAPLK